MSVAEGIAAKSFAIVIEEVGGPSTSRLPIWWWWWGPHASQSDYHDGGEDEDGDDDEDDGDGVDGEHVSWSSDWLLL